MKHALWLVGFRPFFTLAFISGALLPLLWAFSYLGWAPLPQTGLAPVQWHAHEMLFGFGWAVLGGFLLTASKNWVNIRGLHGTPLFAAVMLWIVERIAVITIPSDSSPWIRFLLLNAFLLFMVIYIVGTLLKYRKTDTFKDNYFFIIALPLFLLAKNLTLSPEYFQQGTALSIGLFRVAFAVMFERTITQFMKNAMSVQLYRSPYLDLPIKASMMLAAFQSFLPTPFAIGILSVAAALFLTRFFLWKPIMGFKNFGIAIMYVGYFGLGLHLIMEALRLSGTFTGIGSLSVHVFTFLCMGIVIPGMLIRICQGHTGRKLLFTKSDRVAISLIGIASFARLVATQIWPESYNLWIGISGLGWTLCFAILGFRLIPFLWQPRIDGKIH